MLEDEGDDRLPQHKEAHRRGDDDHEDQPQAQAEGALEAVQLLAGIDLRERGEHGQGDGHGDQAEGELDEKGGLAHPGDRLPRRVRGEVAVDDDPYVGDDDAQHHRSVELQDAAHHGMTPIEAQSEPCATQTGQLGEQLHRRRHQHGHTQAGDIQPAREQHDAQDEAQVVGGRTHRGVDEAFARIVVCLEDPREAVDDDRRHDEAHQLGGCGQEARIEPAHEERSHPPRAHLEEHHNRQQDHAAQAEQDGEHALQLFLPLRGGILAEHRHERRAEHAADEQLVDHLGDGGDGVKGAGDAARTKGPRNHRFTHQAEDAAGHIAQGVDPCRAHDAA